MLDQAGDRLAQANAGRRWSGVSSCLRANAIIRRTSSAPCSAAWRIWSTISLLALVERQPAFEQVKAAEHRGEQVVEVVRDAAGQLADRIHLLRLDQLAFERALLGDVGQRAGEFGRLPSSPSFSSTAWSRKCL